MHFRQIPKISRQKCHARQNFRKTLVGILTIFFVLALILSAGCIGTSNNKDKITLPTASPTPTIKPTETLLDSVNSFTGSISGYKYSPNFDFKGLYKGYSNNIYAETSRNNVLFKTADYQISINSDAIQLRYNNGDLSILINKDGTNILRNGIETYYGKEVDFNVGGWTGFGSPDKLTLNSQDNNKISITVRLYKYFSDEVNFRSYTNSEKHYLLEITGLGDNPSIYEYTESGILIKKLEMKTGLGFEKDDTRYTLTKYSQGISQGTIRFTENSIESSSKTISTSISTSIPTSTPIPMTTFSTVSPTPAKTTSSLSTPTQVPTSSISGNTFGLYEMGHTGNLDVSVIEVMRGTQAYNTIHSGKSVVFSKPRTGYEFIFFKMYFKNTGRNNQKIQTSNIDVYGDGKRQSKKYPILPNGYQDLDLTKSTLSPGESVSGWLVYEVPIGSEAIISYNNTVKFKV